MGKQVYSSGFSTGITRNFFPFLISYSHTAESKALIESTGLLLKGPMETPKGKGVKRFFVSLLVIFLVSTLLLEKFGQLMQIRGFFRHFLVSILFFRRY
jgi:hypothetical protein